MVSQQCFALLGDKLWRQTTLSFSRLCLLHLVGTNSHDGTLWAGVTLLYHEAFKRTPKIERTNTKTVFRKSKTFESSRLPDLCNYSLQSMLVIDKAQDLDDMSLFLFVKLTMEPGPLMLLLAYNDISLESRPSFMRVRNSTAIGMSISLFNLFRLLRLCTSSQEVTPCL